MQDTFKQTLKKSLSSLLTQIEESPNGEITIDIAKVTNDWFSQNIMRIVCGGDEILDEVIDFEDETKDGLVWKKLSITDAIHRIQEIGLVQVGARIANPINYFYKYTGKFYSFLKNW